MEQKTTKEEIQQSQNILDIIIENTTNSLAKNKGSSWNPNVQMYGKINGVTLNALRNIFPETRTHTALTILLEDKQIKIYGRRLLEETSSAEDRIAYECKRCKTLHMGPPEIRLETNTDITDSVNKDNTNLQKVLGHYCDSCKSRIHEIPYTIRN